MARSITKDPFHCFRFAPRVGFDGKPMSVSLVNIKPGKPWHGPGIVEVECALSPEIIEFARISDLFPLIVGVYHITDERGPGGDPSATIVLSNVSPSRGEMDVTPLDAMSSDVLQVKLRMGYDRLTFIFGHSSELNILDKIAAVV